MADAPMPAKRPGAVDWMWLLSAMLLGLALRIPFLDIPMIHDEGGYAYAAQGWVEGTGQLYHDLWISRPQGIFVLYAGIMEYIGSSTVAFRFVAWIFAAVTTAVIWWYGRAWKGPAVGNLAAILFAVIAALPILEGYTANAEIFMGAPAAISAAAMLVATRRNWPWTALVTAGIMAGLATLLKPAGIVMYPLALMVIWRLGDGPWRLQLRRAGLVGLGLAAVGIPTLIHGWMLGWSEFTYATITYRISAQSSLTVGVYHNVRALLGLLQDTWPLLVVVVALLVARYRHAIGGWIASRRRPRWHQLSIPRGRQQLNAIATPAPPGNRNPGTVIAGYWAVAAVVGMAMGGDWWEHYLIQLAPVIALWSALMLVETLPTMSRLWRPALVVIVVGFLILPFSLLRHGDADSMARAIDEHAGYPAQAEVAAYIRENTDEDDVIYVAFSQASIYYLAERNAAYRHLYNQELVGIPGSYAELMAIISSDDRPEYLISTRHPGPFADDSRTFWREVGQYYELEVTIDGVPIYRAQP